MTAWLFVLFAFWIYPILTAILVWSTKNKPVTRRQLLRYCILASVITCLGLTLGVSTTLDEIDWLLLTSLYFTPCLLFWLILKSKLNSVVKIVSCFIMTLVILTGYLSGTIGALGIGFSTAEYVPQKEIRINNSNVYKEYGLGNAISSWGGVRVGLFKSYKWFPILEWQYLEKEYLNLDHYAIEQNSKSANPKPYNNDVGFYGVSFDVTYNAGSNTITLSKPNDEDKWSDVLALK